MDYVIGIDVGTTNTKSILLSGKGKIIDSKSVSYSLHYPAEGWVEQNPEDWWQAVVKTVRGLIAENTKCLESLRGISLSSQGATLVSLNEQYEPVYPGISWMDTRASEISCELEEEISIREIYELTGWPLLNGFCFPNIYWLRKYKPDIFAEVRYFGSTIDFINQKLTGRFAIDKTNLAMMLLIDLNTGDYSQRILDILGLTQDYFPEIIPSGLAIGPLGKKAADELGLPETVPVISGGHDQYCGNIGSGSIQTGDCTLSAGTAWVFNGVTDDLFYAPIGKSGQGMVGSVCPGIHILPGRKGLMSVTPFGGNSLTWFRDVFQPGISFQELDGAAVTAEPGSGLSFIPIMGSASGRGAFLNISGSHTLGDFIRSIYEGVAFINKKNFDVYGKAGVEIKKLIMIGGGVNSAVWPQITADVCGVPVQIPDVKEAPCLGAGIIAAVGCGIFSSYRTAAEKCIRIEKIIKPEMARIQYYGRRYNQFIRESGNV